MRLHPPLIPRTPAARSARPSLVPSLIAAALATTTVLTGGAAQAASSTTPTAPAAGAVSVGGSARPATFLLPTGDVVHRVGTGASARLAFVPTITSGAGAALRTLRTGGTTMVYPRTAAPYLGHELDPGLFTLAASPNGHLAVSVASATAAQAAAVPGLTVTGRSAGTSRGYLDAAGARRFGQALAAQYRTDAATFRATGVWPRKAGIFAGVSSIRPASASATPGSVTPQYAMHTAVVTAKGPDGHPLTDAMLVLANADDMRRYVGFVVIVDGQARVSVPSGHYVAMADTWSEDDGTETLGYTDVTITDDPVQDVVIDLSGPTVTPSISTPVPTGTDLVDLEFVFQDAAAKPNTFGAGYAFMGLGSDAPAPRVLVAGAPAAGSVTFGVSWKQVATDSSGRQVSYSTADLYPDVPATLARKIVPATMARLDVAEYSDGSGSGGVGYSAWVPERQFGFGGVVAGKSLPVVQIAYLDAAPGVFWNGFAVSAGYGEDPGFVDEQPRTYPAAATTKVTWFKAPLTTRVAEGLPFGDGCANCRTASRMFLLFNPWGDADPAHFGELVAAEDGEPVAHLTLKRDGKVVFDKDDYFGALATVPSTPATYQAHLTVDRRLQYPLLSPALETDLTFVSGASGTAETAKTCAATFGTSVTACSTMPLLKADLSAPVDLDDRIPARATSLGLTVGHLDGDAAVTKASLDIRVTGTQTWTSVPLTITGTGTYKASFNASGYKGKTLDVRYDVSDAAGGRLVQTVTAAVKVATA